MTCQIWAQMPFRPAYDIPSQAARIENDGFDGIMVFDSQCLIADPYVTLALASTATSRLGLGVGVTNPVTRHPAVTACAMASVQEASQGRAVLGIGRGLSSLAFLNAPPSRLETLETYLHTLQVYLSGRGFPLLQASQEGQENGSAVRRNVSQPEESRLLWLDPRFPKVPVDVAATGPKVIALGSRLAERITFSVGADEKRLRRAIETARQAAVASGRDPKTLSLGAYVSCVPHPDKTIARRYAAPDVAMHAHISALARNSDPFLSARHRTVLENVVSKYDMTRHGRHGRQTDALDDAFVDENAVIGPPDDCVARLRALLALGLDRLVLMIVAPLKPESTVAYDNLVHRVLPCLRT